MKREQGADHGRYFEDLGLPGERRLRRGTVGVLFAGLGGLLILALITAAFISDLSVSPGHIVEQDSWQLFVFLGAGAAVYVGLLALLVSPVRESWGQGRVTVAAS